jgi:UDP-2-acetamido-3-amino-2,3-dideoxy-glucuronate N-acetyltransferase
VKTPRSDRPVNKKYQKTVIQKGVALGANATIVCGVTVGQYAFVGAGSVLTKDVPDYALMYGNPAQHQGWVCSCGKKLVLKNTVFLCPRCKKKYHKKNSAIIEG